MRGLKGTLCNEILVLFVNYCIVVYSQDLKAFDDTVLFKINWPGKSGADLLEPENTEPYFITTANNEKYQCHIPDTTKPEHDEGESYTGLNPIEILAPLFNQNSCSYRIIKMPAIYKSKGVYRKWSRENLCKAILEYRENTGNVSTLAMKYGIPVRTFSRRIKYFENKNFTPADIKLGRFKSTFTLEEEERLKNCLFDIGRRMFGLRVIEIQRIAFQFAEQNNIRHRFNKDTGLAGRDWYNAFRNKYPEIIGQITEKASSTQATKFIMTNIEKFFELLGELMTKHAFPPNRIFNADETGTIFVPKAITIKSKKEKENLLTSDETDEIVTSVICCNAAGNFIPPTLIIPRKRSIIDLKYSCPPETLVVFHPSGWMQTEIFYPIWFKHFVKHAKPTENDPVLLILDGLSTHVKNFKIIDAAQKAHIHILCLPPHTSHILQPLDLCFMKPFRTYHSEECATWLQQHPGQVIKMENIGEIFRKSYTRAAVPDLTIDGFKTSGICPINSNISS